MQQNPTGVPRLPLRLSWFVVLLCFAFALSLPVSSFLPSGRATLLEVDPIRTVAFVVSMLTAPSRCIPVEFPEQSIPLLQFDNSMP